MEEDWIVLFDKSKTAHGRKELTEECIFNRLCTLFNIYDCANANELTKMVLTFRNCCCGVESVVLSLIESNVVEDLLVFGKYLAVNQRVDSLGSITLPFELDETTKPKLIVAICQFFCNFSASSITASDYLMGKLDRVIDVLVAACHEQHRPSMACCWNFLYNCVCMNKAGYETRRDQLLRNRAFLCTLLLSIQSNNANPTVNESNNKDDPVLEWTHMMIWQWVQQGICHTIYRLIGLSSEQCSSMATVEQIILLQLLLQLFQDDSAREDLQRLFLEEDTTMPTTVQGDFRRFFHLLLTQMDQIAHVPSYQMLHVLTLSSPSILTPSAVSIVKDDKNETSVPVHGDIESILIEKENSLRVSIQQDFITIGLECLLAWWQLIMTSNTATLPVISQSQQVQGSSSNSSSSGTSDNAILARSPQNTSEQWLLYFIEDCDWMRITHDFLRHFDMIQRHKYIARCYEQHKQQQSSSSTITLKAYETIWLNDHFTSFHKDNIKIILQCYQQCIVHSAFMQEYFYEHKDYLHLLLAYGVTDFYNPLTREWAFFTIHSLTLHHPHIRTYLDSLQLQGLEINKSEELQRAGIEVQLNKDTGKISFVQKPPPPPSSTSS